MVSESKLNQLREITEEHWYELCKFLGLQELVEKNSPFISPCFVRSGESMDGTSGMAINPFEGIPSINYDPRVIKDFLEGRESTNLVLPDRNGDDGFRYIEVSTYSMLKELIFHEITHALLYAFNISQLSPEDLKILSEGYQRRSNEGNKKDIFGERPRKREISDFVWPIRSKFAPMSEYSHHVEGTATFASYKYMLEKEPNKKDIEYASYRLGILIGSYLLHCNESSTGPETFVSASFNGVLDQKILERTIGHMLDNEDHFKTHMGKVFENVKSYAMGIVKVAGLVNAGISLGNVFRNEFQNDENLDLYLERLAS